MDVFMADLMKNHSFHCRDPHCPFTNPDPPHVLAERFDAECDGAGGWSHRNLYNPIGLAGEYLTHLAIPEICLHGGIRLLTTPMDGNTPRGEAEIKTATACAHPNGETRWAFTVRPSQRRDHALPLICVGMAEGFMAQFAGRPLVLPTCVTQVAGLIQSVFLIPLSAYESPCQTFIIPATPSQEPPIRALQVLFTCSYRELHGLGLEGLCRIRGIFDASRKVLKALDFVESLGDALSPAERHGYQQDPHRLLADAEAFACAVPLNGRVEEALALRTLRRRHRERDAERAVAERENERLERERYERQQRLIRQELAFAFLGLLTLAAGRPISALEMRHAYGLRRDTYFPPGFNRAAAERGIASCIEGERRRVRSGGGTRDRRLTQAERRTMEAHADEWIRVVRAHARHPFAEAVLGGWSVRAVDDSIARGALALIGECPVQRPTQLKLFT